MLATPCSRLRTAAKLVTAADTAKMHYLVVGNIQQKGTVRLSCWGSSPRGVNGDTQVLEQEVTRPAEKCVMSSQYALPLDA